MTPEPRGGAVTLLEPARPETTSLAWALRYRALGCSVVPTLPGLKEPAIKWKPFQLRRATAEEIHEWWTRWPRAGVAIICGRVSALVVVDIDPRNAGDVALAECWSGPCAHTGGGGLHCYFASETSLPKTPALFRGVDLQAEASYVLAEPSIHPNGTAYRWVAGRALGEVPLLPVPGLVRQHLRAQCPHTPARGILAADSTRPPRAVQDVLGQLEGVRRVGAGWLAQCPAHPDETPSLSIAVGREGRVLLHCFAGCPFAQIVATLDRVPA